MSAHSRPDVILECRNLCKIYQDASRQVAVLEGINFALGKGESMAIMGASGSGKSTLLNLLGGLDRPTAGEVLLCGEALSCVPENRLALLRNRQLGFVYQMHHLLMEFSALENVAMPLLIRGENWRHAQDKAAKVLERVGLAPRLDHRPSQLSGGERQRVAIARALVTEPSCVLMDEPTGNLDARTATAVWDLIAELQTHLAISFVVVTHDLQLAERVGPVWRLAEGKLLVQGNIGKTSP